MRTILLALSFLTFSIPPLLAQESPKPSATLTGHVICSDTNSPARFAKVVLRQAGPAKTFDEAFEELDSERQRIATQNGHPAPTLSRQELEVMRQKARLQIRGSDMDAFATVGADGTYSFKGLLPGTYYVRALMPGYADSLAPFSSADFSSTDPAIRALFAQAAPTVTINGTESARIDLRIDRGAAITGRILYDDGAPAQDWTVYANKPVKKGAPPTLGFNLRAGTDDQGRFRIAGLPAGEYVITAALQGNILHGNNSLDRRFPGNFWLGVYSGNTFIASKAQHITVTAGEERTGVDITVPLHDLHRVSGQILPNPDPNSISFGDVSLTAEDESNTGGSALINPDGSFSIDFVPGNTTYTLKATLRSETHYTQEQMNANKNLSRSRHDYAPTTIQITIRDSDADNIIVSVPESSVSPEK